MRRALHRQALETVGDERSRTGSRGEIAFRKKPLEHVKRCLARHAQLRREIARRRQPRAAGKTPFEYAGSQLAINLSGQVVMPFYGDVNFHLNGYLKCPRHDTSARPDGSKTAAAN